MNKKVDIKSLVIGIVIAFLVVFASGAVQNISNESIGRFQLVASVRSDRAYVVDTITGQVWQELDGNRVNESFLQPKGR